MVPAGSGRASADAPQRAVSVEVATAVKKKMPVRLDALGTVTPIASVAVKARVDTEIVGVHFRDGAMVRQGDVLFTLDGRRSRRRSSSVEAVIAGAKAQLEQAPRDVDRYTELVARERHAVGHAQQREDPGQYLRARRRNPTRRSSKICKVQLGYCTSARRSPAASAWPT